MTKAGTGIMRRILVVIAIVLGIALSGFAETVENVRGSQRESSKLVDIYYDLNDTGGGTYYVEIEVVGRTSNVNAASFSGDVGEGISPGQNRRIVWDAGVDWPDNKGDVKAVVTAIKGGKPNKVQLWEGGPYWADRNIGADNPWDYGLYFWWGDTVGYRPSGTTSDIFFANRESTRNKSIDNLECEGWIVSRNGTYVLASKHDAAQVHWGGGWRMPTDQELCDLYSKCDWSRTTMNGVNGIIARGRGKYASRSIFFPFASICMGAWPRALGSEGYYFSSVPDADIYDAFALVFYSTGGSPSAHNQCNRNYGHSIRPVNGTSK